MLLVTFNPSLLHSPGHHLSTYDPHLRPRISNTPLLLSPIEPLYINHADHSLVCEPLTVEYRQSCIVIHLLSHYLSLGALSPNHVPLFTNSYPLCYLNAPLFISISHYFLFIFFYFYIFFFYFSLSREFFHFFHQQLNPSFLGAIATIISTNSTIPFSKSPVTFRRHLGFFFFAFSQHPSLPIN